MVGFPFRRGDILVRRLLILLLYLVHGFDVLNVFQITQFLSLGGRGR